MTSIFVFYALKFLLCIIRFHSIKKSFISCIDLSWLPSFSVEWWSEWMWSRLCASLSLKFQSCPEVMWNQSDMCSDQIHNCLYMMWIWYTSLSLFVGNLCLLIRRRNCSARTFFICYLGHSFCRSNWFHHAVCCWDLKLLSMDNWILGGLEEQRCWSIG
jgi:hypothetical protein